jgi:hypothetical protein
MKYQLIAINKNNSTGMYNMGFYYYELLNNAFKNNCPANLATTKSYIELMIKYYVMMIDNNLMVRVV